MVPDYNPLDDVLTREVRGSVEGATRPIRVESINQYEHGGNENHATRVLSQEELDGIRTRQASRAGNRTEALNEGNHSAGKASVSGERTRNRSQRTTGRLHTQSRGQVQQNTGTLRRESEERRRQQQLKRKQAARRRRRAVLSVLFLILVILGAGAFVIYQNSYAGVIRKGYRSLQSGEYTAAEKAFQRAVAKDSKRADAYTGLAEVYLQQDDPDSGEDVFLKAIDSQPTNAKLYQAAIDFYVQTEQLDKISSLLDGCDETVLSAVSDYVSEAPDFSLEAGSYTEVQQVTLTGEGTIYYTTDDTEPTEDSLLYEEPILLTEGTTTIRAVTYNEKGVPSLVAARTYTIEIPIEDAPAVTPSTGQYTTATQITIQVPEGYKAYYTLDGSTPSAASTLYTGPVDMPEGSTIFSAVLISDSGKMTQVTKRNYLLEFN